MNPGTPGFWPIQILPPDFYEKTVQIKRGTIFQVINMLWPTFTKDSDDSDDNDTNNNNLKADFELYRNGDDPELDHILEILKMMTET